MNGQQTVTQEEEMIQKASMGSPQEIVTTKKLAECAVALGTAFLAGDGKPLSGERIKEVTKPVGWSPAMRLNLKRIGFLTEDGTVCVDKVVRVLDGPNLVQHWPVPDGSVAQKTETDASPAADLPPAVAVVVGTKPKSSRSAPDFVSSASVDLLRRFDEKYGREVFIGREAYRAVASDSLEPTFYDRVRQLKDFGSLDEISGGWRAGAKGPRQYRVNGVAPIDRKGRTYVPVAPIVDPEDPADDTAAPKPSTPVVAPSPAAPAVVPPVEKAVVAPKPIMTIRPKESIAEEIRAIKTRRAVHDAWHLECLELAAREPSKPTYEDELLLARLNGAYLYYDDIVVPDTTQG